MNMCYVIQLGNGRTGILSQPDCQLCDFPWHYHDQDQGWMKEVLEPQNPDGIINFLSTGGSQNLYN